MNTQSDSDRPSTNAMDWEARYKTTARERDREHAEVLRLHRELTAAAQALSEAQQRIMVLEGTMNPQDIGEALSEAQQRLAQPADTHYKLLVCQTMGLFQQTLGFESVGDDLDDLHEVVRSLLEQNIALAGLQGRLRALEWAGSNGVDGFCPACAAMQQDGHFANCWLTKLIGEAVGALPPEKT